MTRFLSVLKSFLGRSLIEESNNKASTHRGHTKFLSDNRPAKTKEALLVSFLHCGLFLCFTYVSFGIYSVGVSGDNFQSGSPLGIFGGTTFFRLSVLVFSGTVKDLFLSCLRLCNTVVQIKQIIKAKRN